MGLYSADSKFFYNIAESFSNSKLHALDQYWSYNNTHFMHNQIHAVIETILINRGEKTLKQKRSDRIKSLEKSLSISNPMGRLSANIISYVTQKLLCNRLNQI
tara:strand:+ start:659 stop:967 length:309 start_codon:yes stop_codon:yes gene_type:complete